MKVVENADLKTFSFMRIGGTANCLCHIENENDIKDFVTLARSKKMPLFILGDGSNTIFDDGYIKSVFGKISITGKFKAYENDELVNIEVGAGENWDDLVKWTVEQGFSGIECLSLIPGTVGAAPVQNIGAYGQEVKDVITHVRVFDTEYDDFVEIPNDQCLFSYRTSIFKENPGRFIITSVSMQLKKVIDNIPIPQYKDVQLFFLSKNKKIATLKEIREAIISIRISKLPDPKIKPNCGSYFKNPIISNELAENLLKRFPDMPQFKIDENYFKVFAGWLIEKVSLKGYEHKNLSVDQKNALVIINNGDSKAKDLIELEDIIKDKIRDTFEIEIEREPILVSSK